MNFTSRTSYGVLVVQPRGVNGRCCREPETSRTSSILSYAILLGGVLTIAVALYMVVCSYSSLPFLDGWSQIKVVADGNDPLSPAWLWRQHNEHRLILPKLFLAADLRLFQARQLFLLTSIFVIQLLHWGLLCWSMRVLGGWSGALWRTGVGLAGFCLFCPSQQDNFIWGFQVCFILPQLFGTLSFVSLMLYWTESQNEPDKEPSPNFLALSIIAALGATYSLASGILLWPILVAAALYLRLRIWAVLSFAVTGAVSTALYLYHYVRPQAHADPIATLHTPMALFEYWIVYFLSSWSHPHIHAFESIALVGLAIVVMLLLPVSSGVSNFRPFAILLVLTMAFCLGTALITAAGRANFGLGQALTSRYQTVALLCWCCVGLLWLGETFFTRSRMPFSFLMAQVCVLIILGRGAVIAPYPITAARLHGFKQKAASASLITRVYDPVTLGATYPEMDTLLSTVPYIRGNRLSVFSNGAGSELGKSLKSVFALTRFDDCTGAVESFVPFNSPSGQGLRILGWVWDSKHHLPASSIVVTTNGIITGLGAVGDWRQDIRVRYQGISSNYTGFVAFVSEPQPGSILSVYAILHGNPPAACYLPAK